MVAKFAARNCKTHVLNVIHVLSVFFFNSDKIDLSEKQSKSHLCIDLTPWKQISTWNLTFRATPARKIVKRRNRFDYLYRS